MTKVRVAISLGDELLRRVEQEGLSKLKAIQEVVREKLERVDRSRLARESAKLDPKFEQAMAEEGISRELAEWPEY